MALLWGPHKVVTSRREAEAVRNASTPELEEGDTVCSNHRAPDVGAGFRQQSWVGSTSVRGVGWTQGASSER